MTWKSISLIAPSGFNGNLDPTVDTVQKLAEAVDDLPTGRTWYVEVDPNTLPVFGATNDIAIYTPTGIYYEKQINGVWLEKFDIGDTPKYTQFSGSGDPNGDITVPLTKGFYLTSTLPSSGDGTLLALAGTDSTELVDGDRATTATFDSGSNTFIIDNNNSIAVEFDKIASFDTVYLYEAADGWPDPFYPSSDERSLELHTSLDGENWVFAGDLLIEGHLDSSTATITPSGNARLTISLDTQVEAKYVAITCHPSGELLPWMSSWQSNWYPSEIEVLITDSDFGTTGDDFRDNETGNIWKKLEEIWELDFDASILSDSYTQFSGIGDPNSALVMESLRGFKSERCGDYVDTEADIDETTTSTELVDGVLDTSATYDLSGSATFTIKNELASTGIELNRVSTFDTIHIYEPADGWVDPFYASDATARLQLHSSLDGENWVYVDELDIPADEVLDYVNITSEGQARIEFVLDTQIQAKYINITLRGSSIWLQSYETGMNEYWYISEIQAIDSNPTFGTTGDDFRDNETGNIWEKIEDGSWELSFDSSLFLEAENFNTYHGFGVIALEDTRGKISDNYVNLTNLDIYVKSESGWEFFSARPQQFVGTSEFPPSATDLASGSVYFQVGE